jgi:hypothetical protein
LFLIAGAMWGATTVYIQKYQVRRTDPLQILFDQLFFSAPPLMRVSFGRVWVNYQPQES